jgi:predicted GNAT family acetyltransferase
MGFKIVRSRPNEASRLTRIAHRAKRFWGYPEHYISQWRSDLTLSPEFVHQHHVYEAVVGRKPVGFYALVDDGERMELEHFWVDPVCMGSGVGQALLQHAVDIARLYGADAIDICSDPNAEGFYAKMGAKRVGRIPSPVAGKERYVPRLTLELAASASTKS